MAAFDPQGSTAALNAAGYLDSPAGRASYTQDTGATAYPSSASLNVDASGRLVGPPGTALNPGPTTNNPYNASTDGLNALGASISGVTQAQLAQQKAEFDAQLAFAKDQMEKLGIPQLQINQQLAQLQQQQFQAQLSLAQQAQQYTQAATTAQLTGYFTPPPGVPSVSQWTNPTTGATSAGGATGTGQQDQYVQARTQQLMGVANMPQAQAQQTAASEWSQGLAQAGNVAYGMPQGFTLGGTAAPAATGGPTQDQYVTARTTQLQGMGFDPAQASQTALAEWSQGLAQSGNVAGGLPSGISFTAPATTGGAAATGGGGAQQTLAGQLQQAQLTGQYQGAPTEAASEFARQLQLQQGQLGQQYLATAASLQGPQNTFQLSNYMRGAQGNPNVPTYLQSLAGNTGMAAFQGPGTTPPTANTMAGVAGQLGGGQSATPGWDYAQTLGTMQGIANRGAQALAPGALERLTPEELQAFGSGLGAVGGSLPSFLQQYQQSRVGQTAAGTPALA
jgi:hypothetical protein